MDKIALAADDVARKANERIKQSLSDNMGNTMQQLDMAVYKAENKIQYFYDFGKKRII